MSGARIGVGRFLLDTNVVIGIVNGHRPAKELVDDQGASPDRSSISQITRMELLSFPALTLDEEAVIRTAIAGVTVLAVDDAIEADAVAIRRIARLKLPDAIILATARVHGLQLLTLDEKLLACSATLPEP